MKKSLFFIITSFLMQTSVAQVTDTNTQWTWVAGITGTNTNAAYGTKEVPGPATSVHPGQRADAFTWTGQAGELYLFAGFYSVGNSYNDVWKYHPDNHTWTWMHGTTGWNKAAVPGIKGTPAADNTPSSRTQSAKWIDSAGNLWVFGGGSAASNAQRRNDLWKYDVNDNMWTWLNGEHQLTNQVGDYGVKGTATASNQPGSRGYPSVASWVDHKKGLLYMFGGYGYAQNTTIGYLNDLWEYNMQTGLWRWIDGDNVAINATPTGNYGTKGTPDAGNYPPARGAASCWQDNTGTFWMFGGQTSAGLYLNDLWKYDLSNNMWTWVSGDSSIGANNTGIYGTRGVPGQTNYPGARAQTATWVDKNNNLWLFGGYGYGESGGLIRLNDVWKYDPDNDTWTWMFGEKSVSAGLGPVGTYSSIGNVSYPGGRTQSNSWVDSSWNFWQMGGQGITNAASTFAIRNELWKITPIAPVLPDQPALFTAAPPEVCREASSVIYTIPAVAGTTTYEWEYAGGTGITFPGSNITTAPTNTLNFSGSATSGILRVRAVNAGGNSDWRDTTITVHELPVVNSTNTGNQAICAGDSLLLTGSGSTGVNYQWKQGTTNVGTNSATYYAKAAGSYTLTVTSVSTGCSATSAPATTLTVTSLPNISITPATTSICAGESATLTASGATTYSWSPSGDNSATTTVSPATTTTYTVTGTASGCSATTSRQVTVYTLPTATSTNTGNQSICEGDSLLLTASSGSGVNYQWQHGSINVGSNSNTYYAKTAGNYTVTVTNTTTQCTATSTPATVLAVNPLPVVSVITGGATDVCTGETVTLTATSVSGINYQWKDGVINVGANTNTYVAAATGSYKVVATNNATGCADSSMPIDVFVYDRPAVSLTPGDTSFCEGGVVTLQVASQDTGLTYRWKNGNATIPLAEAYFLEISQTGIYTVVADRNQVNNCADSTNAVTVTVHPLPVADITWDGETLRTTPGHDSYQWQTGNQGIPGATDATYQPLSNGGYSVTIVDNNGCSSTSAAYNVTDVNNTHELAALNMEIRIYPNPARDMLYIHSPVPVKAILSSIDGRILQHQTNAQTLHIGNYADGIYLIRITDSSGTLLTHEKIVKQH